ncbi:MAG: hypothetical protein R2764_00520 [Bacteroidales bacterium]
MSPVEFAKQYAKTRELDAAKKTLSKHYQFESSMSLTGSNADVRLAIKPSDELTVLLNLYNKIAVKSQMPTFSAADSPVDIDKVAEDLLNHQGKGLVVSGSNDIYIQAVVNAINFLCGNLGGTFHFERTLQTKKGCDHQVESIIAEMKEGGIGALILNNVNPAYDYPEVQNLLDGMSKVELTISLCE